MDAPYPPQPPDTPPSPPAPAPAPVVNSVDAKETNAGASASSSSSWAPLTAAASTAAASAQPAPSSANANTNDASAAAAAAPVAALSSAVGTRKVKKPKKRKDAAAGTVAPSSSKGSGGGGEDGSSSAAPPRKKRKKVPSNAALPKAPLKAMEGPQVLSNAAMPPPPAVPVAARQMADQLRRVLEDDRYSAIGSIVKNEDFSSEDESDVAVGGPGVAAGQSYLYRGQPVRLDRAALQQAVKHHALWIKRGGGYGGGAQDDDDSDEDDDIVDEHEVTEDVVDENVEYNNADDEDGAGAGGLDVEEHDIKKDRNKSRNRKKAKPARRDTPTVAAVPPSALTATAAPNAAVGGAAATGGAVTADPRLLQATTDPLLLGNAMSDPDQLLQLEQDYAGGGGASIFGQTQGSSSSTWVECDKCKKWRRLRGIVDEKKLPLKWYCSMNKNDPERSRCSALEEEYGEANVTPESAAETRCRKHLRVWVRRLQCAEAFETRQPTLTRGKKKQQSLMSSSATAGAAAGSGGGSGHNLKEPYEWIKCCNASCGKWRALSRILDAKTLVDKASKQALAPGEWYCVMNTWDEKMASCAAPQENLPVMGLPPWVMTDD